MPWEFERVGIHDDFFDLGGNSIEGVKIAVRIRDQFQIDIPMSLVFEARTIAELAGLLNKIDPSPGLDPIRRLERR